MRRPHLILAVALISAAALFHVWTRDRPALALPNDNPSGLTSAESAQAPVLNGSPLIIGHEPQGHEALPPENAAFGASKPALIEAARKGSGVAACRLALSTLLCRGVREMQAAPPGENPFSDGLLPDNAEDDAAVAELVTRRTAELPEFLRGSAANVTSNHMAFSLAQPIVMPTAGQIAYCDSAPEATNNEIRAWVRQAALAGDPSSMIRYAMGWTWIAAPLAPRNETPEQRSERGPIVDHPEYRRWMLEAPQVIDAAIERGDRRALLIALQSRRGGTPLAAARPTDVRRDAILGVVALRLEGRTPIPSTAELGLDPSHVVAADAEAERLYARAFAAGPRHLHDAAEEDAAGHKGEKPLVDCGE